MYKYKKLKAEIDLLKKEIVKYKYDKLTGLKIRMDFEEDLFDLLLDNNEFYFILIDVNGLHSINRDEGYKQGDLYIKKVTSLVKSLCPLMSYRIGGDEFVSIIPKIHFKYRNIVKNLLKICTVSIVKRTQDISSVDKLLTLADELLIKEKMNLYKEKNLDRRK